MYWLLDWFLFFVSRANRSIDFSLRQLIKNVMVRNMKFYKLINGITFLAV
jgi:hypothetical protein